MGELSENEDLNLPLLSTEAKEEEEHSKGEIAQRTCNKTAKIVLVVWSLAAVLVLALLTLDDAWDDLLANTRDIFQDLRSSLQERPLLQEEYRPPRVFSDSERHDFISGSDLDVADETADDGNSAENLTAQGFKQWLEKYPDAFVNLYASWCSHCQRYAPTWEKFAQEVKNEQLPLGVGKVDCFAEVDLCRSEEVLAYPTLRWYHNGERVNPDYKRKRTLEALLSFAQDKLASNVNEHNWEEVQTGGTSSFG